MKMQPSCGTAEIKIITHRICLFIKNWRLNEGLTQREFSELACIHPNSLYHLEKNGLYNILTLLKCIDATELTVTQFFEGIE